MNSELLPAWLLGLIVATISVPHAAAAQAPPAPTPSAPREYDLRLTWGHTSPARTPFTLELAGVEATLGPIEAEGFEPGDTLEGSCVSEAGGGDVDGLRVRVSWPAPVSTRRPPHEIWTYLLEHGLPGPAARLKEDPGLTPNAPLLTVRTRTDGTAGCSIGLEQLLRHRALWLPAHDLAVTLAGEPPPPTLSRSTADSGRVLDRVLAGPEATLAEWTNRWEDIGNPYQWSPSWETTWMGTRGHLVGTTARHGSLYKFGIDRWANVRPDHASPHRFRLDTTWTGARWRGQRIVDGLPVVITELERDGQRCVIEQFAAPLDLDAPRTAGQVPSVLVSSLTLTGSGATRLRFGLDTENTNRHPVLRARPGGAAIVDEETGATWLTMETDGSLQFDAVRRPATNQSTRLEWECQGELRPDVPARLVLLLASPVIPPDRASDLAGFPVSRARDATIRYWEEWLAEGADFDVPEPAVNALFRANLWHALLLPRHRTDEQGRPRIDLPYSNFAYGQYNADWPINQAVYVDYMIYGLRGHFAVAEAELAAMFASQQKPDGRVGGYADWGVYSPGMLYAVAQNYLLSRDREAFERLLPAALAALDWCLAQVGPPASGHPGLVVAPLNDLTHDARAWAFPNAYFVAGLDLFGRALAAHEHPRAAAVLEAAARMRVDVEQAFARASVRSPVVQLADGTWSNYVPCDALTPRRLLDAWYPTDVDCGPLHLVRLNAIDPRGWLATALLHDHEDNLFLNQWGMANEPVYNQQATAYLRRDEPAAAVRAFYSMIACAFSHHQLSPLEHRWAWGQYYMPPSTDGAWFELYRNLLVNELQGPDTLFVGQAIPRAWLGDSLRIRVRSAPTWFGPLDAAYHSEAAQGRITAQLRLDGRRLPRTLLVRFRHPDQLPLRSVRVNGAAWSDFDPVREWVRLRPRDGERAWSVVAEFAPVPGGTDVR